MTPDAEPREMPERTIRVFVSYSHRDRRWFEEDGNYGLVPWLQQALEEDDVEFWYDHELKKLPEVEYEELIRREIARADCAVLLLSQSFVVSPFIRCIELPLIMEQLDNRGMIVIPILVGPVASTEDEQSRWLRARRMLPGDQVPLINYAKDRADWERVLVDILQAVRNRIAEVRKHCAQLTETPTAVAPAEEPVAPVQTDAGEVSSVKSDEVPMPGDAAAFSRPQAQADSAAMSSFQRAVDHAMLTDKPPTIILPVPEEFGLAAPPNGWGTPYDPRSAQSPGTTAIAVQSIDRVTFTVTSPPVADAGASFVLDVWSHLDEQRAEVIKRARQAAPTSKVRARSKGPVQVARGTSLSVRLKIQDLVVEEPEDWILWEGDIGNATFLVTVPDDAPNGDKPGVAAIYVNRFQIARIHFVIQVGESIREVEDVRAREERHRKVFASYASEDGDAVLARIQGMQKVMPSLDVFYAAADLRSGEHWKERLRQEILHRDVMYLFWSEAASLSEWVEWEWRCGYRERGIDFIDPCPLVSPDSVPPPKELADQLHFNDWVLAYMRGGARSAGDSDGI